MRLSTLIRLSLAGNRTDRIRTMLTAASAALAAVALLSAATVASIRGGEVVDSEAMGRTSGTQHYASLLLVEAGLRPGVVFALIMLALPVLALTGQCIRLGAPARDRRLAAIRLSGATPGQTVLIAGAETAAASVLGSMAGFGICALLRVVLEIRTADQKLLLPTDVLPHWGVIAGLLLLVPVLAGAIGALLMRRVVITPLGVVRRLRDRGPGPWAGLAIMIGLPLFALPRLSALLLPDGWKITSEVVFVAMLAGAVLTIAGVVIGTGWISYTMGRLMVSVGRWPAMLLAGRRLMADPWNGSRTLASLLAAVIAGALALGVREQFVSGFAANRRFNELAGFEAYGTAENEGFYLGTLDLIMVAVGVGVVIAAAGALVALAESIVARRRTYAALTATGVPRRTLFATVLLQTLAPLLPSLLLALAAGVTMTRSLVDDARAGGGPPYETCADPNAVNGATCVKRIVVEPLVIVPIRVPLWELFLLGGGAALAMLAVAGIGLLIMRSSTALEELRAG